MRIAITVFALNGHPAIPAWMKYYRPQVDDIYFFNRCKKYRKLKKKYKFKDIDVRRDNGMWVKETNTLINATQHRLIKEYDWVIVTDGDEFIVPDPAKYKGIRDYLKRTRKKTVICSGYDVLHEDGNKKLNFKRPILRQRKKWTYFHPYSKPSLSKVALEYAYGCHYTKKMKDTGRDLKEYVNEKRDKDLYLIHLKRACLDFFKKSRRQGDWEINRDKAVKIPERFKDVF